ncbi:MAG: hypothetical protein II721_01020 [Bacilli bacterium]|nr:hypothetical protein [Bacilli bacterium]
MNEFNDLSTNNTANKSATDAKSATEAIGPYTTSDELSAPADYTDPRIKTLHARSKKVGKAVKTVTIITGSALILGGFGLTAFKFLGKKEASVANPSIVLVEDHFEYSFKIDNPPKRIVTFTVDIDEKNFFTLDVSNSSEYKGTIGNVPTFNSAIAKVVATNNVDFTKVLYSITFNGQK